MSSASRGVNRLRKLYRSVVIHLGEMNARRFGPPREMFLFQGPCSLEQLEPRVMLDGSADDMLPTAQNLGTLSGAIEVSDFVGTSDLVDHFRFSVTSPVREVTIQLDGTTETAYVELIEDSNGNGLVDSGEVLGSRITSGSIRRQATARRIRGRDAEAGFPGQVGQHTLGGARLGCAEWRADGGGLCRDK